MSLSSLKPSITFLDQVKVLALVGYAFAHQVDETELMPVARAWLIENADVMDPESRLTRTLPFIWTRSVCAEVLGWAEFNRDCNAALAMAHNMGPLKLSEDLFTRRLKPKARPESLPADVIRLPVPVKSSTYTLEPIA